MRAVLVVLVATLCGLSYAQSLLPNSPLYQILSHLPSKIRDINCRTSLQQYLDNLENGTRWATQMFDASTKYPDGILATNGYLLGHYDLCVSTVADGFQGKYCPIDVRFHTLTSNNTEAFNRFKLRREHAYVGMCFPSTCKAKHLEAALQQSKNLFPILDDFELQVKVRERECSVNDPGNLEEESLFQTIIGYAMIIGTVFYVLNLYWSSGEDTNTRGPATTVRQCFSLSRQWRKLMSPSSSAFDFVHGLRVVALSIVIIGHRGESLSSGPLLNPEMVEAMFESVFNVIILNGTIFVDTFFTISGFFLCWKILQTEERGTRVQSWQVFVQRYLRLVPFYAVVIYIQAYLMEGMGSGPLWNLKVGKEANNCKKNWWTNLLFINNFWDPQHICIDPSWYLACDFQLLILVPLAIMPVLRWNRYRLLPLLTAMVASFWIPFAVTYLNGLDPTVIPDPASMGKSSENPTNLLLYITTYCRAGPYLVGIAAALILMNVKDTHMALPAAFWKIGWYLATFCIFGSIYLGFPFFTNNDLHPFYGAAYAGSFRTIYGIGIAYILIACYCGRGGILNSFLSSSAFVPLGRISYSVYLTHTLWQQLAYSWWRSPMYVNDLLQAYLMLADMVLCSIAGMALYLTIESPLADLTNLISSKFLKSNRSVQCEKKTT